MGPRDHADAAERSSRGSHASFHVIFVAASGRELVPICTPMLGPSPVHLGLVRARRGPPTSKAECDGCRDAWCEASMALRWPPVPAGSPVASGRGGRGVGGEGRRRLPHHHALDQASSNAMESQHRMQHGGCGTPCGTSCESRVEWPAWWTIGSRLGSEIHGRKSGQVCAENGTNGTNRPRELLQFSGPLRKHGWWSAVQVGFEGLHGSQGPCRCGGT